MFKVSIKNLHNEETNTGFFPTIEEANAWVAELSPSGAFGKPERTYAEIEALEYGEELASAISSEVVLVDGEEVTYYTFAAEFTVTITDITAETLAKKKLSDRFKKRSFGEMLIDKISTINDGKSLTVEQVDAFMANPIIANLREHLWAGNITTFITKLDTSDVSAFFSPEEKAAVIAECQAFLASLEE